MEAELHRSVLPVYGGLIRPSTLDDHAGTMILAESTYRGTTAAELSDRSRWDSFKAAIDQRAIFPRSGTIRLHPNRLELTGRDPGHDVTIHPGELASVSNEFTDLYGRFLGGGSKTLGAPLVLELHSGTLLYLLVNHRWFTERTDNAQWSGRLTQWLTTHREAN